ncbi:hypothetical protein BDN72DRAFT_841912 [Pluteus cervinus]|uniref:Uncharacterized protein n=1 Tax=Pluteus cervinus TaxID=181527 RepID=A0ACD3AS07_9AGAR|nr:hypothetical protein BDN72DRAFT_841912 [Pluteus cervinus]
MNVNPDPIVRIEPSPSTIPKASEVENRLNSQLRSGSVYLDVKAPLLDNGELSPISERSSTLIQDRSSRSILQETEGNPLLPTVKVVSLNPTRLIVTPPVTTERGIRHEDWDTFIQELNRILPADSSTPDGTSSVKTDASLPNEEHLFTFLDSWNETHLSGQGVKVVYCREYPKDIEHPPQYSLYLRDVARRRGEDQLAMELGEGEFDSEKFLSVRIVVPSERGPPDGLGHDLDDG